MDHLLQWLGLIAAVLAALTGALLAAPGDFVSQDIIVGLGIANVVVGAAVGYLARPGLVAYRREE